MVAPRSSFLIAVVAVLALFAAEVDADKSARNARRLKGGKGPKSPKSTKGPKSPKSGSETISPPSAPSSDPSSQPSEYPSSAPSSAPSSTSAPSSAPSTSSAPTTSAAPAPSGPVKCGCRDRKQLKRADPSTPVVCKCAIGPVRRRLADEVVASIGGNPKGTFYEKDSIITKDATERLLKMSEEKYSRDELDPKAPHHQQEWRAGSNLIPERLALFELSGEELVDAIGKDNSKAILAFIHASFGGAASVSKISVQHANMEEEMHFSPHMDKIDTAVVFLGGSNANIVYLNADGESEVITYPGKAVAHGGSTVHKSTDFKGHRHALEIQTMQGGACILANLVK